MPALLLAAALAVGASAQAPPDSARPAGSDARVECSREADTGAGVCRSDVATYVGWRVYLEHCAACHAEDAEGSDFAPSLLHRLGRFDRRAFYAALDGGYVGDNADLGPWGEVPEVARYYDELWTYLSGRAAGTVPPAALEPVRENRSP
ncbi:MAG: hypothetical protein JXB36_18345 [Gammaproteobacteria bacterium]|nr:hypothetical protein [Gammaproteobacteria bacterium]